MGWRVAFDAQVLAQAPDAAVGYRVVLQGLDQWDAPCVVPDPNVMGSPSFWRLRPFQLPDDIRLRARKLYRLLWVDAQGALVPPVGNRHLPALRFFLGPPDDSRVVKSVTQASGRGGVKKRQAKPNHSDLGEHRAGVGVPGESPRVEPTEHEQLAVPTEQGPVTRDDETLRNSDSMVSRVDVRAAADSGASAVDMQPQASTSPAMTNDAEVAPTQVPEDVASSLSPAQDAAAVAALASSSADSLTPPIVEKEAPSASANPAEQRSDDPPLSLPRITVQVGQKTLEVAEATWAAAQAPMEAAQAGASCIPKCSPPLTEAEVKELTGIVVHTEKCAVFMHEVECFHARAIGKLTPTSPEFNLHPDEQGRIQAVACDPRLSRAVLDLRSAWLGCYMQGPDTMYRLPPPFVSLTNVDAGRIRSILNNSERRSYAAYAVKRIESLQTGQPLPVQPNSDLVPKVRRQIRQLVSDARLLTLMQHGIWMREPEGEKRSDSAATDDGGTAPKTLG